jgi:hypothetical protein
MGKVYVTRCIVKKDGKSYKKGSVIENLTAEEIKRGLAENWLEAIGNDDDGSGSGDKLVKASKRDKLLLKAKELGIEVKDEMTNDEIQQLLKEAKA